jgi:hypothetical protein
VPPSIDLSAERRDACQLALGNARATSSGTGLLPMVNAMNCFPLTMYVIGVPIALAGKSTEAISCPVTLSRATSLGPLFVPFEKSADEKRFRHERSGEVGVTAEWREVKVLQHRVIADGVSIA